MNIKKLLVIGGDKRQLYMAKSLLNRGYDVRLLGFTNSHDEFGLFNADENELNDEIKNAQGIILPLPSFPDSQNIVCESGKINIDSLIKNLTSQNVVFASMMSEENKSKFFKKGIMLFDYFDREDLKIKNALATAQGVLKIILENEPVCIKNLNFCVTGCGRCAKEILRMLRSLGACVTLSARKCGDIAWAQNRNMGAVHIKELHNFANNFDVVINTVPAKILDEKILSRMKKDALIIDIASSAGEDLYCAQKYKIKVIKAASLPGKTVPKTAGEIISDTVINIIREGR